jgi:heterodisulfide reductase subunit A
MEKRFDKLGMTPGRLRIEWISAAEGDKYARVLNEIQAVLDAIPKAKLLEEIETLRPEVSKHREKISRIPQVEQALDYAERMKAAMLSPAAAE